MSDSVNIMEAEFYANRKSEQDWRVMYYCVKCMKIHREVRAEDKVFSTGYTLINNIKISLGLCTPTDPKLTVEYAH